MSAAIVPPRARMASFGTGLVLALSLGSTSAVLAQDGPEVTITNFAAAIEAGQTDILPTFFCPEWAFQAAQFDVSTIVAGLAALGLPEGVDPSTIAAGIALRRRHRLDRGRQPDGHRGRGQHRGLAHGHASTR